MKTYPQIDLTYAMERHRLIALIPALNECEEQKTIECASVSYTATGLQKASWKDVSGLCDLIEKAAKDNGYPKAVTKSSQIKADRDIAVILHQHLAVSANEASKLGMWNYLSCCALPHIVKWRWPDAHKDRFITERRHAFKRLWKRAETLYDGKNQNPYWILSELGEDDCVQLLERPALSINHRLGRVVAELFIEERGRCGDRDLMRDITKRLRRLLPFTAFEALSDQQIDEVLRVQFGKSKAVLSASPDRITVSFLNAKDEISEKSGLNWGQRPGRNKNQAYIPIPAKVARSGFFPKAGRRFEVHTDDGKVFTAVIAQDGDKALECPDDNAWIGRYLRKRLSIASGQKVLKENLDKYGRFAITFVKREDGSYLMDFSVPLRD